MKLIKLFSYFIMPVFGMAFFRKIIEKIKYAGNILYAGFISGQLRQIGKKPYIIYPISLYGGKYVTIGHRFFTQPGVRIEAVDTYRGVKFTPKITIGDNAVINNDCHFACINEITIGNDVLIASRVFITDHFHGRVDADDVEVAPAQRALHSKGPVVIEDNVWIGEGVTIMPGVTLGKGCVIGANSVVTKDVPANGVAAGIPAKLIRMLGREKV